MKKKITRHVLAMLLLTFGAGSVLAQEEVTYTLDPGELQPADNGYYLGGNWKDENGDGTEEFYKGCGDYYGDANHNESGTQQEFTYGGAMIMPDCEGKGTPPEGFDNVGYIQLTKFKYPETDTTKFGFIDSPLLSNLRSLTIRTGTDNSLNGRQIFMEIETSLDGGETWGGPFLKQELTNQGGDVFVYEADGENASFNAMVAESQNTPIIVRIRTTNPPGEDKGERVKIFGLEIQASTAEEGEGPVTGIEDELDALPFFYIRNHAFIAERDDLRVYNVMGALIGSGNSVSIPQSGLYIVMSDAGKAKKVFIR